MIWVVNILATFMYLGFGVIYAAGFPKRKHFYCSMIATAAAIFLAQIGMSLLLKKEHYAGATVWMILGYVLMMLALWINVKMTAAVAAYYAVWASCTWYLAYELSLVCCWLLHKRWGIPPCRIPDMLFLVGAIGVIGLSVYGGNLDSGRQALFDRTKTADFCTSFIGNAGIFVPVVCKTVYW